MRVAGTNADISDRFEVYVDPEANPTDLDEALAEFLLSYVRSTAAETRGQRRATGDSREGIDRDGSATKKHDRESEPKDQRTRHARRKVSLVEITIPAGRRPATPLGIKMMIDSIIEIGLLEPIGQTKEKRLIYGERAIKRLGEARKYINGMWDDLVRTGDPAITSQDMNIGGMMEGKVNE